MENRSCSARSHKEASARVASLFPQRWLRSYAGSKLRTDGVFFAAEELLRDSTEPLLDVGCGIGLLPFYLRERGFGPAITGLDVDVRKLRQARSASALRYQNIDFLEHDARAELPPFLGNITLIDVLHYLVPVRQETLLRELAARVAPGGMLLLRDCPRDGSARFWATYAGELFAQLISWNIAVPLHFPTRESINTAFGARDFTKEERPMYGGGPFNNRLFIFRRRR